MKWLKAVAAGALACLAFVAVAAAASHRRKSAVYDKKAVELENTVGASVRESKRYAKLASAHMNRAKLAQEKADRRIDRIDKIDTDMATSLDNYRRMRGSS